MRLRVCLVLSCVIVFSFTIVTCSNNNKNPKLIHLTYQYSFLRAADEKVYLAMPTQLALDGEKDIWVCDLGAGRLFEFDPQGRYKGAIGRKGQGPGEFLDPFAFSIRNDTLIVSEMMNLRVQLLDMDGKYLSSFSRKSAGFSIDIVQGRIFTTETDGANGNTLEEYSREGILKKEFSPFKEGTEDLNPILNIGWFTIYNNRIYFIFMYYPELRVYDFNYNLIFRQTFEGMDYEKISPGNFNFEHFRKTESRGVNESSLIFTALDVNEKGVFITTRASAFIDRFDHDGNFITQYQCMDDSLGGITDFKVVENDAGELVFYVLCQSKDNEYMISVFKTEGSE